MKIKLICQELLQLNSKTKSETFGEERAFTHPLNAETRNYVVYFGLQAHKGVYK